MTDATRETIGIILLIIWLTGCVMYLPIVITQFIHSHEHARHHGRNIFRDWEAPTRPGLLGVLTYLGNLLICGMGVIVHIAVWPGALVSHTYDRIRGRRASPEPADPEEPHPAP